MNTQMTLDKKEAYYEIIEILKFMDKEYVKKLPKKLVTFFKENCAENYSFSINSQIPLKEQKLKEETRAILAMLNLNYWATDEHKQELLQLYSQNEKVYQEELREKYNYDNLFKNKNNDTIKEKEDSVENLAMVSYKESLFTKIVNRIKKLFKR